MYRPLQSSRQTRTVLATFAEAPGRWWHGYDLLKRLGLKSGTLYPPLIRLHEQGMLEAEWQASNAPGRPLRHFYRLTPAGLGLATRVMREDADGAMHHLATKPV